MTELDIGMPLISRDEQFLPHVFNSLTESLANAGMIEKTRLHIVTKESEKQLCEKVKSHIDIPVICSTVPNYEQTGRHSMSHIAEKRNIIAQTALNDSRSSVLFLDSDILVNTDTITRLLKGSEFYDITLAAYQPTWSTKPIIATGTVDDHELISSYQLEDQDDCAPILAGGTGCTLIRGEALKIPFENNLDVHTKTYGDDIGYMINANKANMKICALAKYHVTHLAAAKNLFHNHDLL